MIFVYHIHYTYYKITLSLSLVFSDIIFICLALMFIYQFIQVKSFGHFNWSKFTFQLTHLFHVLTRIYILRPYGINSRVQRNPCIVLLISLISLCKLFYTFCVTVIRSIVSCNLLFLSLFTFSMLYIVSWSWTFKPATPL